MGKRSFALDGELKTYGELDRVVERIGDTDGRRRMSAGDNFELGLRPVVVRAGGEVRASHRLAFCVIRINGKVKYRNTEKEGPAGNRAGSRVGHTSSRRAHRSYR